MELMQSKDWDKQWTNYYKFEKIRIGGLFVKMMYNSLLQGTKLEDEESIELGAGEGHFSQYLIKNNKIKKATLIDFSKESVKKLKEKFEGENAEIKNADLMKLKLKKKYALVHSHGLIEHFTGIQRQKILEKHAELVKEGGFLLISVPTHSMLDIIMEPLNKLIGFKQELYTKKELEKRLNKLGFKIIKTKKAIFGLGIAILAVKTK